MTNSDRLQEIRERAEKATLGPWEVDSELHPAIESADEQMRIYDEGGHGYEDAIFIAEARSDIPYLLQLVTEQQREIEDLREEIDSMAKTSGRWIAAAIEAGISPSVVTETGDPGSAFGTPGIPD